MSTIASSDVAVALDPTRIPAHVAIIMDGNRRWARARGLPSIEGHRRGIGALRRITRIAGDVGVKALTVYGFSTENWRRDAREVSLLLDLCVYFARSELAELRRNNVRVRVIGAWEELPAISRKALAELQERTADRTGLLLSLAVNYSARAELERAVRGIAAEVQAGELAADAVDDACIAAHLYTCDLPDPDILIRPGGEHRLSNFLLYQVAYTELVMTDVYWPDFAKEHFIQALIDFQTRQRRFGGT
ncbi:MAG: polyprenyl diphosphate synthase [Vulcanimicrobiaceae bacterium]